MEIGQYEERLSFELLQNVARSFYLTLRFLPAPLRGTVSLAYLLARATDTVADAPSVDAAVRLKLMDRMGGLIAAGEVDEPDLATLASDLGEQVIPALVKEGERELLDALPDCLRWLALLDEVDATAVRAVLAAIVRGQSLDVERFPDAKFLRSLQSSEDLEEYTYLVAGSVGEFWTHLCVEKLGARCFNEPAEIMARRGILFGKGLQLINILRDLPEDFADGRCYLPEDELGMTTPLEDWLEKRPGKLTEIFEIWSRCCGSCLDEGLAYVEAIRSKRLKYATALPLLFGVRTMALVMQSDWPEREQGIKISRKEVKHVMARAAAATLTKGGIRKLYGELGK